MLDGSNFMQSGWVHGLRLGKFGRPESMKYVIMRKVRNVWIYSFQFSDQYYDNNYHESVVQSYNVYTQWQVKHSATISTSYCYHG